MYDSKEKILYTTVFWRSGRVHFIDNGKVAFRNTYYMAVTYPLAIKSLFMSLRNKYAQLYKAVITMPLPPAPHGHITIAPSYIKS